MQQRIALLGTHLQRDFNQAYSHADRFHPDDVPVWRAFLERVAAKSPDTRFQQIAQTSLEALR